MAPLSHSNDEYFNWRSSTPPSRDKLLDAIRDHTAGEFEVFGEMGRGAHGRIVYLARRLAPPNSLVALRLDPSDRPNEFHFDRLEALDSSVPATGLRCPRAACGVPLQGWGRFCPMCQMDLSGLLTDPGEWGPQELLQAVKDFAHGQYDVLGHMPRSDGGGFVYFARDLLTGDVTALRLQRAQAGHYQLGLTGVLPRVAKEIDDRHPPSPEVAEPPVASRPRPAPETRPNLPLPRRDLGAVRERHRPEAPQPLKRVEDRPPPVRRGGTLVGRPKTKSWQDKVQELITDPRFAVAMMGLVIVLFLVVLLS